MSKRNAIEDTAIGNMGSELCLGAVNKTDVTGQYYAVQFLTEVSPLAIRFANSDGYAVAPGAVTFPAGTVVYGDLEQINTSAGDQFILYKRA